MIDRAIRPPLGAVLTAIGTASILSVTIIAVSSPSPLDAIYHFFIGPFANKYHLGNLLDGASLLMLTGFGVVIAFRGGAFNLGGEGQTYLASLVASQIAISSFISGAPGGIAVVLVVSALAAGAVAAISGFLRATLDIDELISSFLLSSSILPMIDHAVGDPLRDQSSYLLATPMIPEGLRLGTLLSPSTLNSGIFVTLMIVGVGSILFHRTLGGFELRMAGSARKFARYSGIATGKYLIFAMFLSGLLHGFAGGLYVVGTRHTCVQGGTFGLGWNGIAVALIAENRPLAVIPAALAFSYLGTATQTAMLNTGFSFEISAIVQATVFLLITVKRFRWNQR